MKKALSILTTITGLSLIIGLSIWLGFPSPNYNRVAISIVGYLLGVLLTYIGSMCTWLIIEDENDKKND